METLLSALAAGAMLVRYVALGAAATMGVLATVDWAVRTRRLNPFGAVARFCRRYVDPRMLPVERRLVRAGMKPTNAPWWAALGVVIAGLLAIALADFLVGLVAQAAFAARGGPGVAARTIVLWAIGLVQIAIFVRVILSWLPVSPSSRVARLSFTLTEWLLAPLRRVVPRLGMVDISPMVAYFALWLLQGVVRGVG